MQYKTQNGPIDVNVPTKAQLEKLVRERFQQNQGFALATINLDHLVKMNADVQFYHSYVAQDFVIADGNPIIWSAKLAGSSLELLPGSDLVIPLAKWARDEGKSIALLGSTEDALMAASASLKAQIEGLEIATVVAPPFGFDPASEAAADILETLEKSGACLCFLALGAPKQETLAARGRALAPSVGFASIGAGLDFLAGTQIRAPIWMRRLALEWLWRLAQNPNRMWKRYWACAVLMPNLAMDALRLRFAPKR